MPPKPHPIVSVTPAPLYRQIEEHLAAAIYSGQYKPGDRMPTDAELGVMFGVSRITIRHALDRLVAANLIRRQQGVGTFVLGGEDAHKTASLVGDIDDIHPHIDFRLISSAHDAPPPWVAALLPEGIEGKWSSYVAVNHAGRRTLSYVESYFPAAISRWISAEDFRGHVPFARLVEMRAGLAFSHAEQTMNAVLAPDEVARQLKIAAGSPVMRMQRVYFALGGQVIDVTCAYYHPDRYSFSVRLVRGGASPVHARPEESAARHHPKRGAPA